ncbi:hypothetical protein BLX87_12630 [Bacillus sp. VT-16-64]|nr:hypothetical protein BLX87_12630 [Bacillus sp. VT-16-64]
MEGKALKGSGKLVTMNVEAIQKNLRHRMSTSEKQSAKRMNKAKETFPPTAEVKKLKREENNVAN